MTDPGQTDVAIRDARPGDVPDAVRCVVRAFVNEPLMQVFFGDTAVDRNASVARFSELLIRARLAIGAPCLAAAKAGQIAGIAMGYAPRRPAWPEDLQTDWDGFVASTRNLDGLLEDYDRATAAFAEPRPHHYLGLLAIDPHLQGRGLGAALIRAFCMLADRDPASAGVALDTSKHGNLDWYARFGFRVLGSGPVGSATVWSLFRPCRR